MRAVLSSRLIALAVVGIAVLCLHVEPAVAQSGSRGSGRTQSGSGSGSTIRRPRSAQTFESKLWNYLTRQKYQNWAPVPGESDESYPGQSPHGAFLKMFLNRKAAGNAHNLPNGSIIIKENYAADGTTLAAVTVMYRSTGYNPESGDWYWVKYNPDGTVAVKQTEQGPIRLAGKPKGCIECHGGAEGGDFTFFNDGK